MKTVTALMTQYEDQHLAVMHRGQPKKRTQGNGGSWKKMAAARRGMTHHAGVVRRKGRGHTGPTVEQRRWKFQTRDSVTRGTSKGQTFGKRHQTQPECSNGIRKRDLKEQLRLENTGIVNETFMETLGLGIANIIAGTSIRLRKMIVRTLWRGWLPPKWKKRLHTWM